ncbi:small ribosomal subunit Rsm22 family protein [Candidatus Finniella inopinata]|nr:small ribosomal subunit Rsm22 family protein [Candidatus Finniella inopinata]
MLTETKDWCHFSVRLQRSGLHQSAKKGTLGYEDEKFSYLLVAKSGLVTPVVESRIIRKPIKRQGHIVIDVCTGGQLKREIIGKADPSYKKVAKLEWGDEYPAN